MQTALGVAKPFSFISRPVGGATARLTRAFQGQNPGAAPQRCFLRVNPHPHQRTRVLRASRRVVCSADKTEVDGRIGDRWQDIRADLLKWQSDGKLKTISPEAAEGMWQEDGVVFVDVQTEEDFDKVHAIGTVCIPLFTPIEGNSWVQQQVSPLW